MSDDESSEGLCPISSSEDENQTNQGFEPTINPLATTTIPKQTLFKHIPESEVDQVLLAQRKQKQRLAERNRLKEIRQGDITIEQDQQQEEDDDDNDNDEIQKTSIPFNSNNNININSTKISKNNNNNTNNNNNNNRRLSSFFPRNSTIIETSNQENSNLLVETFTFNNNNNNDNNNNNNNIDTNINNNINNNGSNFGGNTNDANFESFALNDSQPIDLHLSTKKRKSLIPIVQSNSSSTSTPSKSMKFTKKPNSPSTTTTTTTTSSNLNNNTKNTIHDLTNARSSEQTSSTIPLGHSTTMILKQNQLQSKQTKKQSADQQSEILQLLQSKMNQNIIDDNSIPTHIELNIEQSQTKILHQNFQSTFEKVKVVDIFEKLFNFKNNPNVEQNQNSTQKPKQIDLTE